MGQIKAFLDQIINTTFLASVAHSVILFDSPCTQGSQQLKNEKCNLCKSGLQPRNPIYLFLVEIDKLNACHEKGREESLGMLFRSTSAPYSLFNTTMLCNGKKKLMAAMAARAQI